jgi:hypothetical protein
VSARFYLFRDNPDIILSLDYIRLLNIVNDKLLKITWLVLTG